MCPLPGRCPVWCRRGRHHAPGLADGDLVTYADGTAIADAVAAAAAADIAVVFAGTSDTEGVDRSNLASEQRALHHRAAALPGSRTPTSSSRPWPRPTPTPWSCSTPAGRW